MPTPFEVTQFGGFWDTHCKECAEEGPAADLASHGGECQRCFDRSQAMGEAVLANPDGPWVPPLGEDQDAPNLYYQQPPKKWESIDWVLLNNFLGIGI